MTSPTGGHDRISTKAKLANELRILGNVLARARERAGLKQFDVAARLNLPPSYLSKVENGTRRLDVIEFVQIANAMNLEPAELLHELETALGTRGPVAVESLNAG
ncbi:MAG TPA: helix-turn-helix transcriptional regulator [Thermoanaerobaculia bacterium]